MRLRYLLLAALLGALCTVGVTAAIGAKKNGRHPGTLFAVALGKKEIGPNGERGVGDPNARGGFTAVLRGNTEFCWGYAVKNVDGTPSGAHIHLGRRGVNGPIVIPLTPLPGSAAAGAASNCTTIDEELGRAIKDHPRRYYFNFHSTPDFPAGAARGQLFGKRN
jgi:hypothetical protein